jgi:hypothetical protein
LIAAELLERKLTLRQSVPPETVWTGLDLDILLLPPSRPFSPSPQSQRVPSVLIAAEWLLPELTLRQLVPPETVWTGLDLSMTALLPSRPLAPPPHNQRVPSVLIAAEWQVPKLTLRQLVPPETVWTGLDLDILLLPPSLPKLPRPQSQRPPSKKQSLRIKTPSKSVLLNPAVVSVILKPVGLLVTDNFLRL